MKIAKVPPEMSRKNSDERSLTSPGWAMEKITSLVANPMICVPKSVLDLMMTRRL